MSWDRFEGISRRVFLHNALIIAVASQFIQGSVYSGVQDGAAA
jgi:hypothetical protein